MRPAPARRGGRHDEETHPQATGDDPQGDVRPMAHERLSLDQEHDGTLAPGQAMTEIETLKADLQVAQEIGDSFWLAIKLLNLPRINVSNPGAHVTELILEIERLRELAKKMTNMMLQAVVNETTAPWEQLVNDIRATPRATPEAGG